MRHLTLEALARLVDEAPDATEQAHLAACQDCMDELEALREQTESLGTLPALMPPPDAWPALSRRMRAEGLIREKRTRWVGPPMIRLAAALALFVAGGATGFLVRGPVEADGAAAVIERPAAGTSLADAGRTDDGTDGTARSSITTDVEETEEMFAAALDRFMQASSTRPPDPAARLAALDNIVLTTAEALNESPGDPVINSYHLTAVAQRKELLRQLSSTRSEPVF